MKCQYGPDRPQFVSAVHMTIDQPGDGFGLEEADCGSVLWREVLIDQGT